MPSRKKTLHFMSSALVTAISVALMGYAMSTQWAEIDMQCGRVGIAVLNGSAKITLKLFNGKIERISCPEFGSDESFEVFPELMKSTDSVPSVLNGLVVCLLALCLLFSAGSILISLYNSVSNPYETYLGPGAVYAFSALSSCAALLAIILFVVNVTATKMVEGLVKNFAQDIPIHLVRVTTMMSSGFYVIIPYILLSLGAFGSIYTYEHAAYTHRREQQRPTEDAPKEIMMY